MERLSLGNKRRNRQQKKQIIKHILIYGAGESGIQLANALSRNQDYRAVAYLDDNPTLKKAIIQGLQVYSPSALEKLIEDIEIEPSIDNEFGSKRISGLEFISF